MAQKTEYQDIEVKGSVIANRIVNPDEPANHLLRADGEVQNPKELSVCEANLLWGGRNICNGFSPIDAAMVSELGANLMAFPKPTGIAIEYSRDGGVTWLDYEATDEGKILLFSKLATYNFRCGKVASGEDAVVGYQLRVTLTPRFCGVYSKLNKIILHVTTNGATNCWCTFSGLKYSHVVSGEIDDSFYYVIINKQEINGWSGFNVLNFSPIYTALASENHRNSYDKLRFTFGYDSVSEPSYSGLSVSFIGFYGDGRWKTPSNLAKYNRLYDYDSQQNALFPAEVESKEVINFNVNNIEPTQTGNVTKTSTWLWQYLVQGVNWLKKNYLPASTLDTKTISDFSDLSPSQVNYLVDSTLTDSIFNQKVTFPNAWKGRKICLTLAPVTFQKDWDYSLKVLFSNYMKATGARLFVENDLSAMVGVNTLIKIIIDNNIIVIEAYIEA